MFDTHCHLNFKSFKKNLSYIVSCALDAGVNYIVIPGSDLKNSKRGVEIADQFENVYAAIGIHPHHALEFRIKNLEFRIILEEIEKLLLHPKTVAVGEIGLDYFQYQETKYEKYQIDDNFKKAQKELFIAQLRLALKHKKSLIFHNREAMADFLDLISNNWDESLRKRTVFHCCEANSKLLQFAKDHDFFIGVDGDLTYDQKKQEFLKEVPLDLLVLETDAPFLLPEPLKSQKKYPNKPENVVLTAKMAAMIYNVNFEELVKKTTDNARTLFNLI